MGFIAGRFARLAMGRGQAIAADAHPMIGK
jgi:hypothetical protein